MKKILFIIPLVLLSLLIISSCEEDNPINSQSKYTLDRFPNQVGNIWTYHRYDSLTSLQDTVTVEIVDTVTIFDSLFTTIWEFHFSANDSTDSQYVNIKGNYLTYIKIFDDILITDFRIEFPIEVNKYWDGGQLIEDSCFVTDLGRVRVHNNQIYDNAYHVDRTTWLPNEYGYYQYWFVPDIGIAKQIRKKLFWAPAFNDVWELISFYEL